MRCERTVSGRHEYNVTTEASRDTFLRRYRAIIRASLIAVLVCPVFTPGAVDAEERTRPSPAGDQRKKPVSFTEFARSAAIDIQDVRSDLSGDKTNKPDELSLAVFCSIHQVFEVRSSGRRLGAGAPFGLPQPLGTAEP